MINKIILYIKRKLVLFIFTKDELNYLTDLAEYNEKDAFRERIELPYTLTQHFDFNNMNNVVIKLKMLFPEYKTSR